MLEELITSSRLSHEDKGVWLEFIIPHLSPDQKSLFFEELNSSFYALENYTESFKMKKHLSGNDPREFQKMVKEEIEEITSNQ